VSEVSKEYQEKMHYDQLTEMLADFYNEQPLVDTAKLIEQIKLLEHFSLDRKRIFCLFSNADFYFKYISANIEKEMGYSPEEIYKGGLLLGYKMVYWKQFSIPIKVHQWGNRFQSIVKHPINIGDRMVFYCGVKMKDKQGNIRTFFIKQKLLSFTENNKVLLSFMEIEEITTIFKGDFVWARFTTDYGNENYTRVFFSEGKKKEYRHLLSEREMEILQLISEKKSSKEIGEVLGIAKNTVERHRKNMIARIGATDMTGLLYLCRLCQVV